QVKSGVVMFIRWIVPLVAGLFLAKVGLAAGTAYTDAEKADADFPFQGEYVGKVKTDDEEVRLGLQVIALGGGKFRSVAYVGGLPGDGWDHEKTHEAGGELKDGAVVFAQGETSGKIKDGVVTITGKDAKEFGRLDKVGRASPTLGARPPSGAVVLFDGKSAD